MLDTQQRGRLVRVHVLPGVPWEYQGMAEGHVLPDLTQRSGGAARVTRTLHIAGAGESWIGEALREITDRLELAAASPSHPEHGIDVGFLARDDEVQVRVTATGPTPRVARDRASAVMQEAAGWLGDTVTSVDERKVEDEVAQLLRAHGWSLATVESCTAGRVSTTLSAVSEGADYLQGGLVVHTADMATTTLGVDRDLLEYHGLASHQAAEALATTAHTRFGVPVALAVVGVAPGDPPAPGTEPGTV
ncbi:MAG: CinA family protein, partial [Nocardioidaceae bacterium]